MKDNLFEMLLNLVETSLTQLQKNHQSAESELSEPSAEEQKTSTDKSVHLKSAQALSTRVLHYDEQMKLTKASYQFLMRMKLWGVIDERIFEQVMSQLFFSESRMITLQETKWTIRTALAHDLNEEQLAFLDLVLYQSEDEFTVH